MAPEAIFYLGVEVKVIRRRPARNWRRRGRKGQVAAVATILGLLLVVTFIANYLTTTLPNQMSVNDLNHDLQVENQLGRLQALLEAAAGAGAVGAQLTQPITLGSVGTPPFAAADQASIGPATNGSSFALNYTLTGPATYSPPTGAPAGGTIFNCPVTCSHTATSLSATGSYIAYWNFTGNSQTFTVTPTGSGFIAVNFTTNSSTINIAGTGSGGDVFQVIGSHNTITMTGVGSGGTDVSIIGNYDTLALSTTGSSPITVYLYGNHDSVTFPSTTGNQAIRVIVYGSVDTFSAPSVTGSEIFTVAFNGFNATAPTSSLCPYTNLSSTDSVTSFNEVGSGGLTQYINNAVGYFANTTGSGSCTGNATCWNAHYRNVAQTTCPFFAASSAPFHVSQGAGIKVHLVNTYAPEIDVAFDQGAVVYAQPSGLPIMLDGPDISAIVVPNGGNPYITSASIFFPVFVGALSSDAGISTAEVSTRLLSLNTIALTPSSTYSIADNSNITIIVHTPFAAAWGAFYSSTPPFQNLWKCTGPAVACVGPYTSGGPLGTVTLRIPTGTQFDTLTIQIATFAVQIV